MLHSNWLLPIPKKQIITTSTVELTEDEKEDRKLKDILKNMSLPVPEKDYCFRYLTSRK